MHVSSELCVSWLWNEQFCYQRVIDWRLGSSVATGSALEEAEPSYSQVGSRNPDESNCPPPVYVWMGCVYAADSVWQGVVSGWCSTAIIWAQGWREMDEDLAWSGWKEGRTEGREGGKLVLFFPLTLVKFCQCAYVQLTWPSFWKWCMSSFVYTCISLYCLCSLWVYFAVRRNRCVCV